MIDKNKIKKNCVVSCLLNEKLIRYNVHLSFFVDNLFYSIKTKTDFLDIDKYSIYFYNDKIKYLFNKDFLITKKIKINTSDGDGFLYILKFENLESLTCEIYFE